MAINLTAKKREIKDEIDRIEDEKLLWAIARLLHLDEDMGVPEWHNQILEERIEKYESGNAKMKDWDEVEKKL